MEKIEESVSQLQKQQTDFINMFIKKQEDMQHQSLLF